ncbi:Cyclin-like superfamily [Arabidopsis suecica]|uniref:Cyclin-like superfamily n=1 Tax=Arabidopsis suecica TaxID=45249 RepID=A0A8T1ZTB3_ARASU|nr:Cyclin-like superfamily [Arabidopsis suecica]
MSTEIGHLRRRLVEFLIQSTTQLELPPIVKYSALSLFFDRFRPNVVRFLEKRKAEHWLLQPLTESNLQLFVLISIWISCKMHCTRGLSVHSLKSFGDKVITEQLFMVRDFLDAELIFLKQVLKFEIGTLNIAYTLLENLFIQFKEVAKVGEYLNFEACMDMMDLLYEKEETSLLYQYSKSLAASILVSSYIITVPKQQYEFPILPWVKMVTNKEEKEVVELVGYILSHVLYSNSP